MQVLIGDGIKAIVVKLFDGMMQLRGELHAGCAGAHNGNAYFIRFVGNALNSQEPVEQLVAKPVRLLGAVEKDAVLFHTVSAEIIGHRPQSHHQVIVINAGGGNVLHTFLVQNRRQHNLALLAIDVGQGADAKVKAFGVRLGAVADRIVALIHGAHRYFMQQRFP